MPEGAVALWPLKSDGSEGNWRASPEYLRRLLRDGLVRLGKYFPEAGRGTVWYLGKSAIRKIDKGEIEISGRDEQGAVVVRPVAGAAGRRTVAKTIWNRPSHHAGWHGSALVRSFSPGALLSFPESPLCSRGRTAHLCAGQARRRGARFFRRLRNDYTRCRSIKPPGRGASAVDRCDEQRGLAGRGKGAPKERGTAQATRSGRRSGSSTTLPGHESPLQSRAAPRRGSP